MNKLKKLLVGLVMLSVAVAALLYIVYIGAAFAEKRNLLGILMLIPVALPIAYLLGDTYVD